MKVGVKWLLTPSVPIVTCLVALVGYWEVLRDPAQVMWFNDTPIETALSPAVQTGQPFLGYWDNTYFFGRPSVHTHVNGRIVLRYLAGPHHLRSTVVWLGVAFVGCVSYWSLRQFGRSFYASLLGATLLMVCGWTYTSACVGLLSRGLCVTWTFVSLAIVHRTEDDDHAWYSWLVAGGFLGLAVAELPDVGALMAISSAVYWVSRYFFLERARRTLRQFLVCMAIYVTASSVIGLPALIGTHQMYAGTLPSAQGRSQLSDEYDWATQWSLPPAESWSLFALDYHGTSIRSAIPYWGTMGQSPGWRSNGGGFPNYKTQSYGIGAVALVVIVFWCVRRLGQPDANARTETMIVVGIAIGALLLSFGKHTPLYWVFYHLPFASSFRNPEKWLGPFALFATIAYSSGIDSIITLLKTSSESLRKNLRGTARIVMLVPLVAAALWLLRDHEAFFTSLADLGIRGDASESAWKHSRWTMLVVSGLVLGVLGALWLVSRMGKSRFGVPLAVTLLGLLSTGELLHSAKYYVVARKYEHLSQPPPIVERLREVNTLDPGRIKLFPIDDRVLSSWKSSYLTAFGFDLFDPVSVRRLSNDYTALLIDPGLGSQRLWELGSVRWFLASRELAEKVEDSATSALRIIEERPASEWDPLFATSDDPISIIENTNALPWYAFYEDFRQFDPEEDASVLRLLSHPEHDPSKVVVVQPVESANSLPNSTGAVPDGTPSKEADEVLRDTGVPDGAERSLASIKIIEHGANRCILRVNSPAPGILRRSVKFDRNWRVSIDGQLATDALLRTDFAFQGVYLNAGIHEVKFEHRPSGTMVNYSMAAMSSLFLLSAPIFLSIRVFRGSFNRQPEAHACA